MREKIIKEVINVNCSISKSTIMKCSSLLILFTFFLSSFAGIVRSPKEIYEYRKFLENSVNGKPQVSVTSELEELQPAWERSGKFEGDILLNKRQIDALVDEYSGAKNAITNLNKLWPYKIIVYDIRRSDFTTEQIKAIEDGIIDLVRSSCLIFKERTPGDRDYIQITGISGGCYSEVGYEADGGQILNLEPNTPGSGCFRHGTIVHEFLHAIGFYHMQSTHNRDDYVQIVWDKIQPGTEHNFEKYTTDEVSNLGTEYDYGSVLHYSEYGFSIDGNKTIVPLQSTDLEIGQRVGMSESDIIKLNTLYECPEYRLS